MAKELSSAVKEKIANYYGDKSGSAKSTKLGDTNRTKSAKTTTQKGGDFKKTK